MSTRKKYGYRMTNDIVMETEFIRVVKYLAGVTEYKQGARDYYYVQKKNKNGTWSNSHFLAMMPDEKFMEEINLARKRELVVRKPKRITQKKLKKYLRTLDSTREIQQIIKKGTSPLQEKYVMYLKTLKINVV